MALGALVGAGCAGADAHSTAQPPAASAAQNELGMQAGETMAFDVELAGLPVGEAQLAVGEIGIVDGRRAIVVKSRAETVGAAALLRKIVDEATTVVDVETGRPISVEMNAQIGDKHTNATAKFSATNVAVTFTRDGKVNASTFKLDPKTPLHDAHTAMAQLRGWKAAPGTVRTVYVIGGRRLLRVDVKYIGEETIGSALGNRRAVIYEGVSFRAKRDLTPESNKPGRAFRVWLSDDGDRVPLKLTAKTELGDVVMTLTDYARP
ncbi:MAG: DUF3108 domain-containing protein [Deltaproteobacteria bacterium]|nr:DUF3108 domain-containing protein [Deltaproteobacteria bacterium]MDQ3298373.1 DUF3108 domain-containing protein [Myxococcota bacterium]